MSNYLQGRETPYRTYANYPTEFSGAFCHAATMAIPPEERVRQLCALVAVAEGAELEHAIAELRTAIRTLIGDAQNVSTYNLINFPAAMDKMDKRKKA
ncbi:MAG: hypothetical protein ABSE28_02485 [Candidatus Sulfotelmatobacter sp.]